MQGVLSMLYFHVNLNAHLACNFNYYNLVENGLLKVTASHVHSKCDNISETVSDKVVVTTGH